MISITADLTKLTKLQREAVAGFILSFPATNLEEDEDEGFERATGNIPEHDDEEGPTPEEAYAARPFAVAAPADPMTRKHPEQVVTVPVTLMDKNGLPWDERIHASSRTKNADGSWRQKRGVDSPLVTTVEAELRALMGLPAPVTEAPAVPVPPPPAVPAVLDASITSPAVASVPSVVVPPPPPAPFIPQPPPAADNKLAFITLLTYTSEQVLAKKLTQEELKGLVLAAGVPDLPLLANRLDLIPSIRAQVETLVASR